MTMEKKKIKNASSVNASSVNTSSVNASSQDEDIKVDRHPSGMLSTHSYLGYSDYAGKNPQRVNFHSAVISDVRKFLVADPAKTNKYILFYLATKLDPELNSAIEIIESLSVYVKGIKFRSEDYQAVDPGLPQKAQSILLEAGFFSLLGTIFRGLVRDGNVYMRIHRGDRLSLELLPAAVVTVVDFDYLTTKGGVIRGKDVYFVNEENIGNTSSITPEKISDLSQTDKRIILSQDILHFSINASDSLCRDILSRDTYGVYGEGLVEPLLFMLKLKLAVSLDYMMYSRTGLPRWDFTIDLSNVMNLNNYVGDYYSRLRNARSLAQEIFNEFEQQLYYYDTDPSSPTYNQHVPVEADYMFIHGSDVKVEQKGGIQASPQFLDVVRKVDMSISSIFSLPIGILGYQNQQIPLSTSIITTIFERIGNKLLSEIMGVLRNFLIAEFRRRGINFAVRDIENLILYYEIDDPEMLKVQLDLEKMKVIIAIQGYVNGLLSKNEAREIMGYPPIEGGDQAAVPPPPGNVSDTVMEPGAHDRELSSTVDNDLSMQAVKSGAGLETGPETESETRPEILREGERGLRLKSELVDDPLAPVKFEDTYLSLVNKYLSQVLKEES